MKPDAPFREVPTGPTPTVRTKLHHRLLAKYPTSARITVTAGIILAGWLTVAIFNRVGAHFPENAHPDGGFVWRTFLGALAVIGLWRQHRYRAILGLGLE